jgi:hypothetical protein
MAGIRPSAGPAMTMTAAFAAFVALAWLRTRDLVATAANYRAHDVKWRRCRAQ